MVTEIFCTCLRPSKPCSSLISSGSSMASTSVAEATSSAFTLITRILWVELALIHQIYNLQGGFVSFWSKDWGTRSKDLESKDRTRNKYELIRDPCSLLLLSLIPKVLTSHFLS